MPELTYITCILPSFPIACTDPDILADVLVQSRQLEQVVALGVAQNRNINLHRKDRTRPSMALRSHLI